MVLFPGPGALDIETIDFKDNGKRKNLIVVDGTWRQAG